MKKKIEAYGDRDESSNTVSNHEFLVAGEDVEDLTMLTTPEENDVAVTLRARLLNKKIYTRIGHSVLIAVNSFDSFEHQVQSDLLQQYIFEYKNPIDQQRLEPHIFQLTSDAYLRMRRMGENQVILFSGGLTSGKSTSRDACLTFLTGVGNHKRVKRHPAMILDSQVILEAFGTIMTKYNSSESQYGSLLDIHFNAHGHIVGGHLQYFNFNDCIVTNCSKNQHNFNVFSYLLSGASGSEIVQCHLQNSSSFNYIGNVHRSHSAKSRDEDKWMALKASLKSLGFKQDVILQIMKILSAILLIGNLILADDSITKGNGGIVVNNTNVLMDIADLLEIEPIEMEDMLRYRTKVIRNDLTSKILTWREATKQRQHLAATLYILLVEYIVNRINQRLCSSHCMNSIALLDIQSMQTLGDDEGYKFSCNYMSERAFEFRQKRIFGLFEDEFKAEGIQPLEVKYNDNVALLDLYTSRNGIFPTLNTKFENKNIISQVERHLKMSNNALQNLIISSTHNFTIRHYTGNVSYSIESLYNENHEADMCSEFAPLFCQDSNRAGSKNSLLLQLFSPHLKISSEVKGDTNPEDPGKEVAAIHDATIENQKFFHHTVTYSADDFCEHFSQALALAKVTSDMTSVEKCEVLGDDREWDESDILIGTNRVFLSDKAWRILENDIRVEEKTIYRRFRQENSSKNVYTTQQLASMPTMSNIFSTSDIYNYGSETDVTDDGSDPATAPGLSKLTSKLKEKKAPTIKLSRSRKLWLMITWAVTWWIPTVFLDWIGRMKRPDIRMAWREKFTLCSLILLLSAAMVWFIAFFSHTICPVKHIYSQYELQSKTSRIDGIVSIRGEVFDLAKFAPRHWASDIIPNMALTQYAGQDISHLFPVQVSSLCDGAQEPVPKAMTLDNYVSITDPNAKFHDFRYFTDDYRPDWYYEKMTYLRKNYRLGFMGYDASDVRYQANNPIQFGGITSTRKWAILNGDIYDLTFYFMGGRSLQVPRNQTIPEDIEVNFIDNSIAQLFKVLAGTDITDLFNRLPLDRDLRERQLVCLRNLFLVGKVDNRNSAPCVFSEYLLLIISGFLCSVILFKFVAALQVTSSSADKEYNNFIVCQVPCYTEGEESIRKTVNSIATLKYDDKRKLLFIITDGMIVGSGNEKSTPRIVLDILGVDDFIEREALYYNSIGEGYKQHNMAKVYSGLYQYSGHTVPYVVVVKVGNLSERQKPGNRGKRDSQMVLLQFLNKVHYQSEMNPLEYEIYHQIQNVIGVNPFFYEYVMMVDADTEVLPHSLNSLVSSFVNDDKIIGMCGETMLSNEKDTWITMIQVYEYYISHYLSKAFESLFGTVTCLPGCFCMYRIRSVGKNQALLVSNIVMLEYGDNKVDTLHKKNLLHLGEDRYLTTLILKHFPKYKTKFNPNAACLTSAPDSWSVLVSQRRRWINSTIHNLGELIFLPQMCGFCCFSMRFVVILDLLSTLVMPAVVCYLGYLIYEISTNTSQVPLMSLITLASVYGLQAFIFIVRRKWEHIAWLIIYIIAIPVFSFFIPIYAYWHFDDFSWGNTRMALDNDGDRKVEQVEDDVEFDPSVIPKRRWQEYEDKMEDQKNEKSEELAKIFGRDMSAKRAFINESIVQILEGRYPDKQKP
ncbi:chitin synthase [Umbelopsis sp. PMI_123]|nr:chitin synthase [Umbelopsis sp. PMI_123]